MASSAKGESTVIATFIRIRRAIQGRIPLSEAALAHELTAIGHVRGKIILTIG